MIGRVETISVPIMDIQKDCVEWAKEIEKTFRPELIIFIAKSGFLFAQPMADYWGCDMVDVSASRPTNGSKDRFKSLARCIPDGIVHFILSLPINYFIHNRNKERNIVVSNRYLDSIQVNYKKILLVDDSVDTGWSMIGVRNRIRNDFTSADIRLASYSVIDFSKRNISIDYMRYLNKIVFTGTSRKSKEYQTFMKLYSDWKDK